MALTRPPRWFRRHRTLALGLVNVAVLLGSAILVEVAFRFQVVDFWQAELRRYNTTIATGSGATVLLLGDSFSAGQGALADQLRLQLGPRVAVINSAVSGTTARDALLVAPRRLERFRPQVVIYQVYIGNDLFETRHAGASKAALGRRLYWTLLDRGWWSLGWGNYKLGQLRDQLLRAQLDDLEGDRGAAELREAARPFDPRAYRSRDRQLAAAAPRSIADQVLVSGSMVAVWGQYAAHVRRLADLIAASGSTLVVVAVPHCVQVSARYQGFYRDLGAELPTGDSLARHPSEFARRLAVTLPEVAIVDPLAAMQSAEARGQHLYRTNDPHLNAEGQLLLAQVLASHLLASGPLFATTQHSRAAETATTASVTTVAHAAPRAP